jgi:hypothetical protein
VLTGAPAGSGEIQFFSANYQTPQINQADIIFERQIAGNTTVSASYLLSLGRHLPTFLDRNLNPPTDSRTFNVVGGPFDGQTFTIPVFLGSRPNSGFGRMTEIASVVNSEYNAMVLQVNRRFSNSLQFLANYTLSKATDTNQTSTTFTTGNVPFNVFDLGAEQGRSTFDRRNKFVVSAVYSPRVKLDNKSLTALADGWTVAPVFQAYTGLPYNGTVSNNLALPAPSGSGTIFTPGGGFNGSGSSNNRLPLIPRNAFTGPSVKNIDLRISRRFYIKENMNIEFLGEAFNLFNSTQITGLNQTFYALGSGATATTLTFNAPFATTTEAGGTLYRERQIQLGLRFQF